MTLPYQVDFRGHAACPCQVRWIPELEHQAQRLGILFGPLPISQLIGGAVTSGGTHATGGAGDDYPLTGIKKVDGVGGFVWLCRQMGADATWHRRLNWDNNGGVEHVHWVLRGCPHNGPARYQIVAVDAGFNGLGHLGQGAPDDGPRPLSGRTWREGIAWGRLQEDDMFSDDDRAKLDTISDQVKNLAKSTKLRDKRLRDLVKRRFNATDADLDEIFGKVDSE